MSTVDLRGRFWTSPTVTFLAVSMQSYTRLIHDLFSNNEQGFVYDPNDLSTMFQDAAGTVPVTAAGQPVGLVLDKSKNLALGVEKKGAATTRLTGSANAATYNLSTGEATCARVDFSNQSFIRISGLTNTHHKVAITNTGTTPVSVRAGVNSGDQIILNVNAGQSATFYIVPSNGAVTLTSGTGSASFTINYIKELVGNHAYQTVSASRPLVGRHPVSGVRNLVRNSYDVNSSIWERSGVTITPAGLGVNGNPCYNVNPAGGALSRVGPDIVSLATGQIATTSFYAKKGTGARSKIIFENQPTNWNNGGVAEFDLIAGTSNGVGTSIIPVSDGWYRCSVTRTVGDSVPNRVVLFVDVYGRGTVGNDVNISDVQVEVSTTATTYQTVRSVTDITEAGVTSINNLYFDGVDHFLRTNNIDFTATDKVSLFAGVRKLSDANIGAVFGLSSAPISASGVFEMYTPQVAGGEGVAYYSRGASTKSVVVTQGLKAPTSFILSAQTDIANNTVICKINQSLTSVAGGNLGGGSFSNNPLFIGRRGGTSLPFNGHLYSLIGVGRLSTDSETIALEKELAKRTGVTLSV